VATLLGGAGITLAYLAIGLGLVLTAWSTRAQHELVPKAMMFGGFVFLGISVFLCFNLLY